jgi:DNA-binding HxlR family transcriptional regulator
MELQKETSVTLTEVGPHGKWYDDACGTAFAMELVGERWSLMIVRELILGGRRFSDLRRVLPAISAKVLSERLDGLERAGILIRRQLAPPAPARVYELTEWGYLAEPAIQELGRWAARSRRHDPTLPLSPVSLMMSLRTMLDRDGARGFDADIGFVIGEEQFRARLSGGQLPITRAAVPGAQAVFNAPAAPPIAAHFYGRVPADQIDGLEVTGDRDLAARFAALFSLPPKCD